MEQHLQMSNISLCVLCISFVYAVVTKRSSLHYSIIRHLTSRPLRYSISGVGAIARIISKAVSWSFTIVCIRLVIPSIDPPGSKNSFSKSYSNRPNRQSTNCRRELRSKGLYNNQLTSIKPTISHWHLSRFPYNWLVSLCCTWNWTLIFCILAECICSINLNL